MLQVILDTRKMSDETRNYLENLIALKDAMDEAEQALDDYLQETFGSLGQGMLDSITSAIKGSGTALGNFADQAASVLENLGEQIAYSLFSQINSMTCRNGSKRFMAVVKVRSRLRVMPCA